MSELEELMKKKRVAERAISDILAELNSASPLSVSEVDIRIRDIATIGQEKVHYVIEKVNIEMKLV